MALSQIEIHGLRNLSVLTFLPEARFNFISGHNGSGKTSLLEALFFLAHGRSFRTHQLDPVIANGQLEFSLSASFENSFGRQVSLGVQRGLQKQKNKTRLDGEDVESIADLARELPMLALFNDTFRLLESGPKLRREFIDWGLFHMELEFYSNWRRWQRCLKQRNAALRQGLPDSAILPWDKEFVELSEHIDRSRQDYTERFSKQFFASYETIAGERALPLTFRYCPGWDRSRGLAEELRRSLARDRERMSTSFGPHRADLEVCLGEQAAQDILSRGQIKVLIVVMKIVQAALLREAEEKKAIYLLDDIFAELDEDFQCRLLLGFEALEAQVFLTGVSFSESLLNSIETDQKKLFQIAQGAFI